MWLGTGDSLYYIKDGKRITVPAWVQFYVNLGLEISSYNQPAKRLVIALAVPTRAFAAALVAFGVTVGASATYYQEFSAESHLKQILSLKCGAPITYRRKERQLKGKYLGYKEYDDGLRILLKLQQDTEHWIPAKHATRIRAETASSSVTIPKHQQGRRIARSSDFLSIFLDEECANDLLLRSKLMCTFVGRISLLRSEIVETQFAARRGEPGVLNDVLRARRFVSKNNTYRSHILPADKEMAEETAMAFQAPTIVFDGASGFIKWHHYWPTANWIAVLDRTERNFDPAVTLLNQYFIQNRVGNQPPLEVLDIPAGVEIMAYEEACR